MKKYVALVSYSPEGWASVIEKGLDRSSAVAKSMEQVGGKLDAAYWMMSHYDGLVIFEVPDDLTAMALTARISASGIFRHVEIHQLFEHKDHAKIIEMARGHEFHDHKHHASPRHSNGS